MTEHPAGIVGVADVVDGDTIYLKVDTKTLLGIKGELEYDVRLLGINAPEHNTPGGKRAIAWIRSYIQGQSCLLQIHELDKYGGRVDGTIWLEGDSKTLQERLVDAGHAMVWNGVGEKPVKPEWLK